MATFKVDEGMFAWKASAKNFGAGAWWNETKCKNSAVKKIAVESVDSKTLKKYLEAVSK